jgi:hypothetical protein
MGKVKPLWGRFNTKNSSKTPFCPVLVQFFSPLLGEHVF